MTKPKVFIQGGKRENVFAIIALVSSALHRAKQPDRAREFTRRAFQCKTHGAVLVLVHEYVEVE